MFWRIKVQKPNDLNIECIGSREKSLDPAKFVNFNIGMLAHGARFYDEIKTQTWFLTMVYLGSVVFFHYPIGIATCDVLPIESSNTKMILNWGWVRQNYRDSPNFLSNPIWDLSPRGCFWDWKFKIKNFLYWVYWLGKTHFDSPNFCNYPIIEPGDSFDD